jgi:uncharacterized protein (DUF1778 family)
MPTVQRQAARRDTLNLRIKPEVRKLIDRAARLQGMNRTEFVVGSAFRSAEEALLDRTQFHVDKKAYAAFLARLDAPPALNDRLRRTLQTTPPWKQ